jgi:hypothetical protein
MYGQTHFQVRKLHEKIYSIFVPQADFKRPKGGVIEIHAKAVDWAVRRYLD